jgi:hypothetical protein
MCRPYTALDSVANGNAHMILPKIAKTICIALCLTAGGQNAFSQDTMPDIVIDDPDQTDPAVEGEEQNGDQQTVEPDVTTTSPIEGRKTNKVAEFSGLDKITGRIISFDVYVNETVQFGALQVTPRVCYSRPASETPKTTSFIEVDEITLDRKIRRIFTGWMFADSPGLNAVEHPVYDVWLKSCKDKSDVPAPAKS